jgi:hypothetical protein
MSNTHTKEKNKNKNKTKNGRIGERKKNETRVCNARRTVAELNSK